MWAIELRREESRRALEYGVGPAQLAHLLLELGDPALLRGRGPADQAIVDVGLSDPGAHALDAVAKLKGDPLDGSVARAELVAQRPNEADGLRLLVGDTAPTLWQLSLLRRSHDSILVSKVWSLQPTQGDSAARKVRSQLMSGQPQTIAMATVSLSPSAAHF